jgi:hypothetical protein
MKVAGPGFEAEKAEDVREYLSETKPVSKKEFASFWKSLTDEEKADAITVVNS